MENNGDFDNTVIFELKDSLLVLLKDKLDALMVSFRIDTATKNSLELLHKRLAKYGMLFDHARADGNLIYILEKISFEKQLNNFEWPKRLQILGNYLEEGSYYCWSNYFKTQSEEFEFLMYAAIQGNHQVSTEELWLIDKSGRTLSKTKVDRVELPSSIPDPLVVDLSHWKLSDKVFQEDRKEQWPAIEDVLINGLFKKKRAINVIKKYYFKGELPDWAALNDSIPTDDVGESCLDIAIFLWLHPSSDAAILAPLAKAYYDGGYGRLPQDVKAGMHNLLLWGVMICAGATEWHPKIACFDGKARLMFNIIYDGLSGVHFYMKYEGPIRVETEHEIVYPSWGDLKIATEWLCQKKIKPYQETMILQYLEIVELIFKTVNLHPNAFVRDLNRRYEVHASLLYRIAYFDIEKEGDTPRSSFVKTARAILDRENHFPEINDLWKKIKNNEITVKNPWKL
jgi:hypothetical protein